MKMPEYTMEQKAAAFDQLWEHCGHGHPVFHKWKIKPEPFRPSLERMTEVAIRIPVMHFTIAFDGNVDRFADVLHYLATKEKAPDLSTGG